MDSMIALTGLPSTDGKVSGCRYVLHIELISMTRANSVLTKSKGHLLLIQKFLPGLCFSTYDLNCI